VLPARTCFEQVFRTPQHGNDSIFSPHSPHLSHHDRSKEFLSASSQVLRCRTALTWDPGPSAAQLKLSVCGNSLFSARLFSHASAASNADDPETREVVFKKFDGRSAIAR
jgi:hypothetical protein